MAELSTSESNTGTSSCCAPETQQACCESSEKTACCGTSAVGGTCDERAVDPPHDAEGALPWPR
jgi:hypothetical protein